MNSKAIFCLALVAGCSGVPMGIPFDDGGQVADDLVAPPLDEAVPSPDLAPSPADSALSMDRTPLPDEAPPVLDLALPPADLASAPDLTNAVDAMGSDLRFAPPADLAAAPLDLASRSDLLCDPVPDAGAPFATVTDFCHDYLLTRCALETRCGLYRSISDCLVADTGPVCLFGQASVDAGRATLDGRAAQVYLQRIRAGNCDEDFAPLNCAPPLTGRVANGAPCRVDYECADPKSHCKMGANCAGACTPIVFDGQPTRDATDCSSDCYWDGAFCRKMVPPGGSCAPINGWPPTCLLPWGRCVLGTCVEAPSRGQACDLISANRGCKGSNACNDGTCGARGDVGVACAVRLSTGREYTRVCLGDLRCVPTQSLDRNTLGGVCAAKGAAGAACFGPVSCAAGLYCAGWDTTGQSGACAPQLADGSPCASNDQCTSGSTCDIQKKICVRMVKLGGACSLGGCEPNASCVNNVCQPQLCWDWP